MESIVVSFIGKQDHFSSKKHSSPQNEEGSLVTLVRHLQQSNDQIQAVILLYTDDSMPTGDEASGEERKNWCVEWLSDHCGIAADYIRCFKLNTVLSHDPIDTAQALVEAREGTQIARKISADACLELNASSGTPAMKSAWSLLLATGYVSNCRVWQVRDPRALMNNQPRVFESDTRFLKNELDTQTLIGLIENYDYASARDLVRRSFLKAQVISSLLNYGYYRLAFDFKKAHEALDRLPKSQKTPVIRQLLKLPEQRSAWLGELYFNALIKLKRQEYCDFLGRVFRFQEAALQVAVERHCGVFLSRWNWDRLRNIDGGKLWSFLERYGIYGHSMQLSGDPKRHSYIAVLKYYQQDSLIEVVEQFEKYAGQRNQSIIAHGFDSISQIPESEAANLLNAMRQLVNLFGKLGDANPFDQLNQEILSQLRK
jgi:CRISPR-associated protein (Cas_Csm6)